MKRTILLVAALALLATGCKDATRAQFFSMGKRHRIQVYSGGVKVGEWIATGNVNNEQSSDGFQFEDESTHMSVEVSGTVVISQID